MQDCDGFLPVSRGAPDARTCEAHGAEAETIHRQITANKKGSAGCSGSLGCVLHIAISLSIRMERVLHFLGSRSSNRNRFAYDALDIAPEETVGGHSSGDAPRPLWYYYKEEAS